MAEEETQTNEEKGEGKERICRQDEAN